MPTPPYENPTRSKKGAFGGPSTKSKLLSVAGEKPGYGQNIVGDFKAGRVTSKGKTAPSWTSKLESQYKKLKGKFGLE
jgi:hypothetical protein